MNANEFPDQRFLIQRDIETFLIDFGETSVGCYNVVDVTIQTTSKQKVPECVRQQTLK